LRDLDQASLAAVSQQLAPREGISQEVRRNVLKSGESRLREGVWGRRKEFRRIFTKTSKAGICWSWVRN
jgi:hypothetical protein